jgi:N-carbamoyl-L-amino-acid hydrolase
MPAAFEKAWSGLAGIGRDGNMGGYRRLAWTDADLAAREWFVAAAADRGLDVQPDRAGNLWAWWLPPGEPRESREREPCDAVVTGSHLDTVPDGGAFDGALGIVSGLCAIDLLRERGGSPHRPIAVVAFADEEGGRFGLACAGSRVLTGAVDPDQALALVDADGITMAEAIRRAGLDPTRFGPDEEAMRRVGTFVELHIEQGRALVEMGAGLGVASGIWPHGRWRLTFTGRADHAGTTQLADRRDPTLCLAEAVLAARDQAERHAGLATIARIHLEPNVTNAIASSAQAWLDARAADQQRLDAILAGITERTGRRASAEHVDQLIEAESLSPAVDFDARVRKRIRASLGDVPELATGAGHDAGVLAARVPAGMLFVRNPTGVSHAPAEHAERADCLAGVQALADVLADQALL